MGTFMLRNVALFHLFSVLNSISLYKSTVINYSFLCLSHVFFLFFIKQCDRQKSETAQRPPTPAVCSLDNSLLVIVGRTICILDSLL